MLRRNLRHVHLGVERRSVRVVFGFISILVPTPIVGRVDVSLAGSGSPDYTVGNVDVSLAGSGSPDYAVSSVDVSLTGSGG